MEDGDERDATRDVPTDSDGSDERLSIEGLRPPLTLEQRRRRAAIVTIVIAAALVVLLWPAISSVRGVGATSSLMAQATATSGFSWRSAGGVSVAEGITVVAGSAPDRPMCPVTPQSPSTLGIPEMHADIVGNGDVWA